MQVWTGERYGPSLESGAGEGKTGRLVRNIRRLADMEDPELTDFWKLLGYRDAITPRIQRAALAAEVYYPCELYYHAPEDVRDGLIHVLLSAENSSEASELMCCLAMQGDDRALETLLELEKHPRHGERISMWTRPSTPSAAAGPLIRKGSGCSLTSIPAIRW